MNGQGYDPFAYGQVRLGGAAEPSRQQARGPVQAAVEPLDDDWAPSPSPAAEPTAVAVGPAVAAAAVDPGHEGASAAPAAATRPRRPVVLAAMPASPQPAPRPGALQFGAPFVAIAAGEAAAVWLWQGQHNPILAGLCAVLGLGLGGLCWILFRR
jgi:hypothetical protein